MVADAAQHVRVGPHQVLAGRVGVPLRLHRADALAEPGGEPAGGDGDVEHDRPAVGRCPGSWTKRTSRTPPVRAAERLTTALVPGGPGRERREQLGVPVRPADLHDVHGLDPVAGRAVPVARHRGRGRGLEHPGGPELVGGLDRGLRRAVAGEGLGRGHGVGDVDPGRGHVGVRARVRRARQAGDDLAVAGAVLGAGVVVRVSRRRACARRRARAQRSRCRARPAPPADRRRCPSPASTALLVTWDAGTVGASSSTARRAGSTRRPG